jgi:hypothetical protein
MRKSKRKVAIIKPILPLITKICSENMILIPQFHRISNLAPSRGHKKCCFRETIRYQTWKVAKVSKVQLWTPRQGQEQSLATTERKPSRTSKTSLIALRPTLRKSYWRRKLAHLYSALNKSKPSLRRKAWSRAAAPECSEAARDPWKKPRSLVLWNYKMWVRAKHTKLRVVRNSKHSKLRVVKN